MFYLILTPTSICNSDMTSWTVYTILKTLSSKDIYKNNEIEWQYVWVCEMMMMMI